MDNQKKFRLDLINASIYVSMICLICLVFNPKPTEARHTKSLQNQRHRTLTLQHSQRSQQARKNANKALNNHQIKQLSRQEQVPHQQPQRGEKKKLEQIMRVMMERNGNNSIYRTLFRGPEVYGTRIAYALNKQNGRSIRPADPGFSRESRNRISQRQNIAIEGPRVTFHLDGELSPHNRIQNPPVNRHRDTRQQVLQRRLDVESLTNIIQLNKEQIQYCYNRELKSRRNLQGKLRISMQINMQGRVNRIRFIENDLGSNVANCVERVIRKWQFPKPERSHITVEIPFDFYIANQGIAKK